MGGHSGKTCPCQRRKNERHNNRVTPQRQKYRSEYNCRVCSKSHPLRLCWKFIAMSVKDRHRAVRSNGYCINCLGHDHHVARCHSTLRCTQCKKSHHTLLHFGNNASSTPRPRPTPATSQAPSQQAIIRTRPRATETTAILVSYLRMSEAVLLPTINAHVRAPDQTLMTLRCLLSTGTAFSSVYKSLPEKIGAERFEVDKEVLTRVTLFSVLDPNIAIEHVFRVQDFEMMTPSFSLPPSSADFCRNIALADPTFYESSEVDIIIGMDIYNQVIIPGRLSRPGQPDAMNTIFGYAITGTFGH